MGTRASTTPTLDVYLVHHLQALSVASFNMIFQDAVSALKC